MILHENYIKDDAFNKIHGKGHKHDFIFIDKENDLCLKNFDEEI